MTNLDPADSEIVIAETIERYLDFCGDLTLVDLPREHLLLAAAGVSLYKIQADPGDTRRVAESAIRVLPVSIGSVDDEKE